MRAAFTSELGPVASRKSNVMYRKWIRDSGGRIRGEDADPAPALTHEDGSVVSLRLLKRSNEQQMRKIYLLLRAHPDTVHYYLENFIFPVYMDNKVLKLSAAGCDLGGEMLFSRRIGFSGTPSDLLPIELGRCHYELGSDGQMMAVLTSPDIVSHEVANEAWSPESLLQRIATSVSPRFHALIDTGALITGLTNLQVAQRLLALGLPWAEGVVFLDELDRKVVLVRSTGRVLNVAQCGIALSRRFAFYDQIHTTGMDISHCLDAAAALTLSKDMVFRDYAQGAFRMRGIGRGQTVRLVVIPEVVDLISRELRRCSHRCPKLSRQPSSSSSSSSSSYYPWRLCSQNRPQWGAAGSRPLVDVLAWLVLNSMKSERLQFNQLCVQNVSNAYRKVAFAHLAGGRGSGLGSHLCRALDVFCEPVDFSLDEGAPSGAAFADSLRSRAAAHAHFISAEDAAVVERVAGWAEASVGEVVTGEAAEASLSAEIVQEQEQVCRPSLPLLALPPTTNDRYARAHMQEVEQEQEQEQEIEIEKYVDLAYSREEEAPEPWPFSSLGLGEVALPDFYCLSSFQLYKRRALAFPDFLMASRNYFNPMWSGARRIKNVVMVLDWVVSPQELAPSCRELLPSSEQQTFALESALALFDSGGAGCYSLEQARQAILAAANIYLADDPLRALLLPFSDAMDTCDNSGAAVSYGVDCIRAVITSGKLGQLQGGRRFVALSLAEAETIRFIMHRSAENPTIALRCLQTGFEVLDRTLGYCGADEDPCASGGGSCFMNQAARDGFRFLNCDYYFSADSLNVLLRCLHPTTRCATTASHTTHHTCNRYRQPTCRHERRQFFSNTLSCRRRLAKKWADTPVAKLFLLTSCFALLKQRSLSLRLRGALKVRKRY